MPRLRQFLFGALAVVAVLLLAVVIAVGYDAPCGRPEPLVAGAEHIDAIVYRCYGGPEVLALERIAKPVPAEDQFLVRVHAASVNPLDSHYLRGKPYLMRLFSGLGTPTAIRMGADFAGVVEVVGSGVRGFVPGERVFGASSGSFGEYILVRAQRGVAKIPPGASFADMAAMPIAAVTAIQALRDKARMKPGQKVLVNGASGGVGTYAVQIAKTWGAEVTGVCSSRNVELVQSLGADRVIDYTTTNFTAGAERYDVIIDNVGTHSLADYRRVLEPDGVLVMIGSASMGNWLDPLVRPVQARLLDPFVSQRFEGILADMNAADLQAIAGLHAAGQLRSVIDRRYWLGETADAIGYVETGRARGKVLIDIPATQ
ncbi:MAG: NAD(P)-dependent alcohol dehydrogenase [Gammaproteobacteria bacterium]|nr:NAD(P)-dependent alcohol dehydrogenase [Gammaproteobacteria bacterium]